MSKQAFFTKQLAQWLSKADWHYNTLLVITIECTGDLPDDCNVLIDELLLCYPVKPSQAVITEYLLSSNRLKRWFSYKRATPRITRVALQHPAVTTNADTKKDEPIPAINSIGDLALWFAITIPELEWFANFWRCDVSTPGQLKHYRYDLLEKRDGSMRLIEKPKARLKQLQRKIYHEILIYSDTHTAARGFCKGRNCMSHASIHVGKRYLMTYDIADCFHSTPGYSNVHNTQDLFFYFGANTKHRFYNAILQGQFRECAVPNSANEINSESAELWAGISHQVSRNWNVAGFVWSHTSDLKNLNKIPCGVA